MKNETLIVIGAVYNLAFAVFHVFFWKLFQWKEDLASLNPLNRAVMQVLNLCLTFAFLIFAYVSFFHTSEMLASGLGRSLLALIAIFWFLRAIQQMVFFARDKIESIAFFVVFLVGGALYTVPLLR